MARIMGSFVLGFGSGFAITFPTSPQEMIMTFIKSGIAGMITALPRLARILEEYGRQKRK